jgi:hypothetical protein
MMFDQSGAAIGQGKRGSTPPPASYPIMNWCRVTGKGVQAAVDLGDAAGPVPAVVQRAQARKAPRARGLVEDTCDDEMAGGHLAAAGSSLDNPDEGENGGSSSGRRLAGRGLVKRRTRRQLRGCDSLPPFSPCLMYDHSGAVLPPAPCAAVRLVRGRRRPAPSLAGQDGDKRRWPRALIFASTSKCGAARLLSFDDGMGSSFGVAGAVVLHGAANGRPGPRAE